MWILIPGCQHIYFDDNGGLGNAQCADSQGPYLTMPTVPNTLVIWARDAFGNTVYVILPPLGYLSYDPTFALSLGVRLTRPSSRTGPDHWISGRASKA